jgi:hypothetical protein
MASQLLDRKTIIALVLAGVIITGFSWYRTATRPPPDACFFDSVTLAEGLKDDSLGRSGIPKDLTFEPAKFWWVALPGAHSYRYPSSDAWHDALPEGSRGLAICRVTDSEGRAWFADYPNRNGRLFYVQSEYVRFVKQ